MNLEAIWAEVEEDQAWRMNEIRFFQNECQKLEIQQKQDQFRRAIVLLLYAHFEGYCKFVFSAYINVINNLNLKCHDVNFSLAAASLATLFEGLRNPASKSPLFQRELPDDAKLHRFARDREFLERTSSYGQTPVVVPDSVIDVQSNLKPVVLKKILFRLGFRHDQFDEIQGTIHQLLNYRNRIAHGEMKDGIEKDRYEALRDSTFHIMRELKSCIMNALNDRIYLRDVSS